MPLVFFEYPDRQGQHENMARRSGGNIINGP